MKNEIDRILLLGHYTNYNQSLPNPSLLKEWGG
jgi:hypothetical protein